MTDQEDTATVSMQQDIPMMDCKTLLDEYAKHDNAYKQGLAEKKAALEEPEIKNVMKRVRESKAEKDRYKEAIVAAVTEREKNSASKHEKRRKPSRWGPPIEDSSTLNKPVVDGAELSFRD